MNEQIKSPAGGQGLDYSRGGESLEFLCRKILEKSNGGRIKCTQPLLWQWTNNAMPLVALTGNGEVTVGAQPHPFVIANAARRAAESGYLYPIYLLGDGKPSLLSYSVEQADAWLRGEERK